MKADGAVSQGIGCYMTLALRQVFSQRLKSYARSALDFRLSLLMLVEQRDGHFSRFIALLLKESTSSSPSECRSTGYHPSQGSWAEVCHR